MSAQPIYMGVVRDRFGSGLTESEATALRAALGAVLEGLGSREEVPWADRSLEEPVDHDERFIVGLNRGTRNHGCASGVPHMPHRRKPSGFSWPRRDQPASR